MKEKRNLKNSGYLDFIGSIFNESIGFEKVLFSYKIKSIKPYLKGVSFLDIGCGLGFLCKALVGYFDSIVGIDGSSRKIKRARQINCHPKIEYIETLFSNFNPGRLFDTIAATNVLEHIKDPIKFLSFLKSMLSDNGRVIITVPNALGLHKRIGKAMGLIEDFYKLTPEDIKKGHKHIYDIERLKSILSRAAFKNVRTEGILLKPLPHKKMERMDARYCDGLYEVGKKLPDYCSSILAVAEKK